MSARAKGRGPGTAVLLYWLLVVCGLAGLTVLRFEDLAEVAALWIGSVVGVAVGQLSAHLRLRAWLLGLGLVTALWFALPVLLAGLGPSVETGALAFVPALICGYLSLSERAGLVAFWSPAVLWMLIIVDGSDASALEARGALPFAVGLSALFVAFLRARETRRAALWRAHGDARIAAPVSRTVLRASPLRSATELGWTAIVGASALVLAAWIAPHLWQKEQAKHASAPPSVAATSGEGAGQPCCPDDPFVEAPRARTKEYFTPRRSQREAERERLLARCTQCRFGKPVASWQSGAGVTGGSTYGSSASYEGEPVGLGGGGVVVSAGGGGAMAGVEPSPEPLPATAAPVAPVTPFVATTPSSPPAPPVVEPSATIGAATDKPTTPEPVASPTPAAVEVAAPPAPPAPAEVSPAPALGAPVAVPAHEHASSLPDAGVPWRSALAISVAALAVLVLVRVVRRALTLRHLARPFWAEPVDQRISNHWQRILVALADAGVRVAPGEQPRALAVRTRIEGMEACATILERVRHGVRVDAGDLDAMDSAADAAVRAARRGLGPLARAAAWLRAPLA